MSTLLIVQSHQEAKEQLFRNWPHLQLPGWPILGVVPEDSIHSWPADITHCEIIGKSKTAGAELCPNLVERWVKTWETLTKHDRYKDYTDYAMTEADSVFVGIPPAHPGGMFTHLCGGGMEGFKCSRYYHPIWWADRKAAEIVAEEGRKMIQEGEFEHGSPDCFLGLLADRRPDLVINETGTFSVNGEDFKNRKEGAAKEIPGNWYVHGFRTDEELRWIIATAANAKFVEA